MVSHKRISFSSDTQTYVSFHYQTYSSYVWCNINTCLNKYSFVMQEGADSLKERLWGGRLEKGETEVGGSKIKTQRENLGGRWMGYSQHLAVVGDLCVSLILQAMAARTFMVLVGPLKSDRLKARDQTKINCFFPLQLCFFSSRCRFPFYASFSVSLRLPWFRCRDDLF